MIKKYLALALIYFFNCLPIKKNKIFLFSYYGSQYGCSPKYITEYILNHYPKGKFDIVWAFNNPNDKKHLTDFRKVKTMSIKYFYELCTSKVVITNFRTTDLYVKRKNQYYIQTWHSSLRLKQIEKDTEKTLPNGYLQMAKNDSRKCDLLLSGCEYSTKIFKRAFWYNGEILESGIPANDLLFSNDLHVKE
ncbi:CDP-glycerol glycerophosphotransferase family protein, partial [Bacillus sp. JJ1764]|uniref:CDP-glycerol glycerophosphotransferase family protein n=1 Tax=Bacillus sp. JJ1764 TaxID=3122964 RepID=UPI002FFEFDB6